MAPRCGWRQRWIWRRLNGYFERGLHPWDHAAGALIAAEAGAHVGGLRGERASDRFILAAEPGLAVALERALIECEVSA